MAKNILVIDDEQLVIESLRRLLKKEGYDVTIALNGREALEKITQAEYDLVISDIRMPELDGIEIIKNIREFLRQNKKKAIPEILITGYSDEEILKQARQLKVADYIYKPFDTKEFLEIIKKNI
ncbi:MAG: response regulator [Candidatus Omnitrophica bacterium]|nr:response regulator [Candidatus Omnitrophota bacterium]